MRTYFGDLGAKGAVGRRWRLKVSLLSRHDQELDREPTEQPFALILTISDPARTAPVYDEMVRAIQTRWRTENLNLRVGARPPRSDLTLVPREEPTPPYHRDGGSSTMNVETRILLGLIVLFSAAAAVSLWLDQPPVIIAISVGLVATACLYRFLGGCPRQHFQDGDVQGEWECRRAQCSRVVCERSTRGAESRDSPGTSRVDGHGQDRRSRRYKNRPRFNRC